MFGLMRRMLSRLGTHESSDDRSDERTYGLLARMLQSNVNNLDALIGAMGEACEG
jgi:hypothetical protein